MLLVANAYLISDERLLGRISLNFYTLIYRVQGKFLFKTQGIEKKLYDYYESFEYFSFKIKYLIYLQAFNFF